MSDPQQVTQPPKKGMSPLAWVAIGCVGLLILGAVGVGVAFVMGASFVRGKAESYAERWEANPELEAIKVAYRFVPEIDVVDSDSDRRTVTLRNTRTGEEVVLDFEEASQGTFRFATGDEEGEIRFGGDQGILEVRGREGTVRIGGDPQRGVLEVEGSEGRVRIGGGGEVPSWVPVYPGTEPQALFTQDDPRQVGGMIELQTSHSLDRVAAFYRERLEGLGYEVNETRFSGPDGEGALVAGENRSARRTISMHLEGTPEGTLARITYQAQK
jgi:hypothetical protein